MKYLFIILATFATASAAALPQSQNELHHLRGKRSPEYPPVSAEESMDEINPVKLIKAGSNLINILEQFLSSKANATPVFTFDLGDFITNNLDLFPDIAKILKSAGKEFGIDDPNDLLDAGSNILSIIDLVVNGKNSTMPIISVALAKFIKKNPDLFPIFTRFLKSSEKEFGVMDPVELIKDGSKVIYTIDHVLNQGESTLPFFGFSLADYIKNNLDLSPALRANLSTAASDLRDFINKLVDVLLKGKEDDWDIFAHYSEIFKKLKQEGLTLTWV
ncbi:hypothetical protein BgiMline_034888 [Biomphalaria glabrata]|nr:hypothetical protein BgiMline_029446 [Biomphalaria glabrata]